MEPPTDFFRKTLNEFRTADELLSGQLQLAEDRASAQMAEMTSNVEKAKSAASNYLSSIKGVKSDPVNFNEVRISPEIDVGFSTLKNLAASASENKSELEELNDRIVSLEDDLKNALLEEERERQALERARQEARLKEAAERKKRRVRYATMTAAAICTLIILHFWLLSRTTLSFTVSVDGKPPSADRMPTVTIDGKLFVNGDKMKLGRHHLSVELKNFEPIEKDFRAFYGAKDLGALSLEFSKGSVSLLSDPADAEFELSGNGRHWQGELPISIDDVPVGVYQLVTRRKGWDLNQAVTVSRSSVTTNQTIFQYGSVEVTSDPSGLIVSSNGVEIGKTPMIFQQVIPGQYTYAVSDGENALTNNISVAPKESAQHTFIFHYSAVQVSSTPSGATVIWKGKEAGKTPLTLNHIPAEETTIGLQLQDYISTNFSIRAVEGVTTNLSVKLISQRHVQAMKQALDSLDEDQFEQASNFVAIAIESDPTDTDATALLEEITHKADMLKQQQLAAAQAAAEEKVRAHAAEFAAIPVLDPSALINDCWNPKNHEASDNMSRAVGAPVEVALNVVMSPFALFGKATGQKGSSIKDVNNGIRFDMAEFDRNWKGRTMSYSGIVESVQTKDNTVVFMESGSYPRKVCVAASLTQENVDALQQLTKGDALTIIGEISTLNAPDVMSIGNNQIALENVRIHHETTDADK